MLHRACDCTTFERSIVAKSKMLDSSASRSGADLLPIFVVLEIVIFIFSTIDDRPSSLQANACNSPTAVDQRSLDVCGEYPVL